MPDTDKTEAISPAATAELESMVKAGVLYGRTKSKTNPRMQKYIYATRNGIQIIDLTETLILIDKAGKFLRDIVKNSGTVLVVGTRPSSRGIVEVLANKYGFPFVVERWLGGTLTNFKTISQRLEYYITLKKDRAAGRLEKYTKKERVLIEKKIARLTRFFHGLENLTGMPQTLIVVGPTMHETAVREANRLNIPIIAIMNTDANPDTITHPIISNDNARSSIQLIFDKLEVYIKEGIMARVIPESKDKIAPKVEVKK